MHAAQWGTTGMQVLVGVAAAHLVGSQRHPGCCIRHSRSSKALQAAVAAAAAALRPATGDRRCCLQVALFHLLLLLHMWPATAPGQGAYLLQPLALWRSAAAAATAVYIPGALAATLALAAAAATHS
jgi:hypothetical protein